MIAMILNSPLAYLRAHWAGQQGLGWTFWVNLAAVRVAITLFQPALKSFGLLDNDTIGLPVFALGAIGNAAVFLWQVVGVLRAAGQHIRDLGAISTAWGAQLGLLVAFWFVVADIWGLWIMTVPQGRTLAEQSARQQHADDYSLIASDNGETIALNGEIAPGITKAFASIIARHPALKTVTLTSEGGNIYEARGLAKLISDAGLATTVVGNCSSACTTVFIGGTDRRIGPGAKIGFHQYKIDADYTVHFADPRAEEARDRAAFEAAGVSAEFLDRAFQEPAESMWYPAPKILFQSGVLTVAPDE